MMIDVTTINFATNMVFLYVFKLCNQNFCLMQGKMIPSLKTHHCYVGGGIEDVDAIILSHGHYDHSDGLQYLNKKYKLICHPKCLAWRKSNRTLKYNGLPFNKDEFLRRFDVMFSKSAVQLDEQTFFLGEIKRKMDFECHSFPSKYRNGKVDTAKDDTGIAIKTKKGLVVVSGCGHSGICNTIEQAKRVAQEERVYAVLGGFHLKEINPQVDKTIEYFLENKIQKLYLGHCTSDEVCEYIKEKTKNSCDTKILGAGQIIDF